MSDLAQRVRTLLGKSRYTISQSAYDLRKLRGKGLVSKGPRSRRYQIEPRSLRALAALVTLRDDAMRPLLAGALAQDFTHEPRPHVVPLDQQYRGFATA